MPYCWKCRSPYTLMKKPPGFHDMCDSCKNYWHSCCNCARFTGYPTARCTIPNVGEVHDREGANFCDEFALSGKSPDSDAKPDGTEVRRKWDDLFKN